MNFEQAVAAELGAGGGSGGGAGAPNADGSSNGDSSSQAAATPGGAGKRQFVSWKERRVDYARTSEFIITSMAPYCTRHMGAVRHSGDHWLVVGCRNGDVWEAQLRTGQLRNVTCVRVCRVVGFFLALFVAGFPCKYARPQLVAPALGCVPVRRCMS